MSKYTPLYSAFALISIESLWPNSAGTEVPINFLDVTYLNDRLIDDTTKTALNEFKDNQSSKADTIQTEVDNDYDTKIVTPFQTQSGTFTEYESSSQKITFFASGQQGTSVDRNMLQVTSRQVTVEDVANNKYKLTDGYNQNENTLTLLNSLLEELSERSDFRYAGGFSIGAVRYSTNEDISSAINALIPQIEAQQSSISGILSALNEIQSRQAEVDNLRDNIAGTAHPDDYGIYPSAERRPGFNSILNSADAYKKRRGYFKIIPLNVISVNTSTSLSEGDIGSSSFEASFTMDDLLVFADTVASESIINTLPASATATPVDIENVFQEFGKNFNLSNFLGFEDEVAGMTAFRVSADDFPFNIEDIVEANDTVSIWLYHDPKEFDFVANENVEDDYDFQKAFIEKKDFSYVIGNGSRQSQDDYNVSGSLTVIPKTFVQSTMNDSGILSPFTTPESLSRADGRGVYVNEESTLTFIETAAEKLGLSVTGDYGPADAASRTSEFFVRDAEFAIDRFSTMLFSDSDLGFSNNFRRLTRQIYLPLEYYNENTTSKTPIDVTTLRSYDSTAAILNAVRDTLSNTDTNRISKDDTDALARAYTAYFEENHGDQVLSYGNQDRTLSELLSGYGVNQVFTDLVLTRGIVQEEAETAVDFIRTQNVTEQVNPGVPRQDGYFTKRQMLITQSHGETPYLALKGHISSVSSNIGTATGSYRISITGHGYEKILKEHILYYDDLFSPKASIYAQNVEGIAIYSQMFAPKAILNFLETNVPRFFMIGRPSGFSLDARNMSLYFSGDSFEDMMHDEEDFESLEESQSDEEDIAEESADYDLVGGDELSDYLDTEQALIRGNALIDLSIPQGESVDESGNVGPRERSLRFYYPVNYLNTTRIREMINILTEAYKNSPKDALFKIPITPKSGQSIANNLMQFNGTSLANQMFVDETGRFRQRTTFEALERTPKPEYMPTIDEESVLSNGINFTRDSSPILNMVDFAPQNFGQGYSIYDALFSGRTLSKGNDYIPFTVATNINGFVPNKLFNNFYETISEPLFRYGLRYKKVHDVYSPNTQTADKKSVLAQSFYSKPIKSATVSLLGNPSYRAGETVLVSLPSTKYRSREIVDVNKTIDWLNYLKGDLTLREMYIGVDTRWIDNESYYLTQDLENNQYFNYWLSSFREDPHTFVLDAFIETFEFIQRKIGSKTVAFITPEYFPTTYWAFSRNTALPGSNFGVVDNKPIQNLYNKFYNRMLGQNEPIADDIRANPQILNAIKMQDFRATSYYIDRVKHTYSHGESFATSLSLTHGQDTLTLLEPYSMRPIGFMSIEKRMRIGYDDRVIKENGSEVYEGTPDRNTYDRRLWDSFEEGKRSDVQVMYVKQFEEDRDFKENSFLYTSQRNRNSSNFMHRVSVDIGSSE